MRQQHCSVWFKFVNKLLLKIPQDIIIIIKQHCAYSKRDVNFL